MRQIVISHYGRPQVLTVREIDAPQPGEGEILVRVEAAGVNFRDVQQRSGAHASPMPPPAPIGVEGAGTIVAVGARVHGLVPGDRVAWTNVDGSYAEQICLAEADAVPLPDGVSTEDAAALLAQGLTAHYLTTSAYRVSEGETVLVLAAAGGVGRLITQLAAARGARVLGVVSESSKSGQVLDCGAERVIVGHDEILSAVHEFTSGAGVNVVYDGVGGAQFMNSVESAQRRGVVVLFGSAAGEPPLLDIRELALAGSVTLMRPRLIDFIASRQELLDRARDLFDWLTQGTISIHIAARYQLSEAPAAHQALESRTVSGKLLLCP
jgi:NADPH2:quinone reductase